MNIWLFLFTEIERKDTLSVALRQLSQRASQRERAKEKEIWTLNYTDLELTKKENEIRIILFCRGNS